jgi:pilus assembly protein CpaC
MRADETANRRRSAPKRPAPRHNTWSKTQIVTMLVLTGVVCGIVGAVAFSSRDAVSALFVSSKQNNMDDVAPPPRGAPLDLVLGHGRLLHLDEPVEAVFLGDPAIADVNVVAPDYIYVIGKKLGTTNLIAIALQGVTSPPEERKGYLPAQDALKASLRINVIADTHPANDAARKIAPRTTAEIAMFGRRVVLKGKMRTPEEAKALHDTAQSFSPPGQQPINNTTIEGAQQVNIRVRFAEVSRSDMQTLGIDWQLFSAGDIGMSMLGLHGRHRDADANELIDALQRNGVLTVLAEPNLTAITGQEASFLAGGEIPVPVPQGKDMVTMMYKQFGVSLVFKPTLVRKNRIALHIKPEVSMVSNVGAVVSAGNKMPSFIVRRADTTVEVASGQTFAIGGLFQRNMSQNDDDVSKAPLLGDMPVLGALFQSPRFRRNETELVILVTPYLVNPVEDRMLALPTDRPNAPASPVPRNIAVPVHAAAEVKERPRRPAASTKDPVKKAEPAAGLYMK